MCVCVCVCVNVSESIKHSLKGVRKKKNNKHMMSTSDSVNESGREGGVAVTDRRE